MRFVLALSFFVLGCSPPEGRFACTADDECPLGWSCVLDHCYSSANRPDAAGIDAAAIDAAAIDAAGSDPLDVPATIDVATDACVGSDSDPLDCDTCGNVCPSVEHGVPACEAGACTVTCEAPYALVPSPTDGVPRCSQFGGLFVESATSSCPSPNPYTGTCTCPAGFVDRNLASWAITGLSPGSTRIHVCEVPTPVLEDAWGGFFVRNETLSSCVVPNGFVSGTANCTCTAGYASSAQIIGLNVSDDRMRLVFCRRGPVLAPGGTIATAFTRVVASGASCVADTCLTSASCVCPGETTPASFPNPTRAVGVTEACDSESTLCLPVF